MKKSVLILSLLLLSIVIKAQCVEQMPDKAYYHYTTVKQAKANAWKTIGMYTASITLNAVGDALNDKGEKEWGHACNALSIGTLLAQPFVCDMDKRDWYKYLLTYTSLRLALFDPIYNSTRGLPINYTGGSALTDKFQQKFGSIGIFPERTLALIVGITIPLKEFRR